MEHSQHARGTCKELTILLWTINLWNCYKSVQKTIAAESWQDYVQIINAYLSITPILFSDKNDPVIYIDTNLLNYVLGYKTE